MAALVLLHVTFPLEALATVGTHEGHFLRVDLHMAHQTTLVEESLAALRACVRTLFLMDSLVCCESCPVGEALPAVAGVHSLFLMSLQVSVEVADTAEAQLTVRAFVRTLHLFGVHAMSLQVPHKCRLPGERPAAL